MGIHTEGASMDPRYKPPEPAEPYSLIIVTSGGNAIPVPHGAIGPTGPEKGTGMVYQGGEGGWGFSEKTAGVRIMDKTNKHLYRCVYSNEFNQKINPYTGQTVGNNDYWAHIPLGSKHD